MGPFLICGDLNTRISEMADYIEGVDVECIDIHGHTQYGKQFVPFLIDANCRVLNHGDLVREMTLPRFPIVSYS